MKLYQGKPNRSSRFKVGQRVRFQCGQFGLVEDTVTGCFWQHLLLEPYGRNLFYPALTLDNHSWVAESNVIPPKDEEDPDIAF